MNKRKHNRRNFLKVTGAILFGGAAVLWDKMVNSDKNLGSAKILTVPVDLNREFTFHDDFIIVKKDNGLQVFSSRCTHLGCIIHNTENDQLICPCHGSIFDKGGNPMKGPAIKPLEKLAFSLDEKIQQITIEL